MKTTLREYVTDSQKVAAEKLGVSQTAVGKHLKGGGFRFEIGCRYEEVYEIPRWILREHDRNAKECGE